jgi:hypothetical protein
MALVSASLGQTGPDGSARPDIDVRWTRRAGADAIERSLD